MNCWPFAAAPTATTRETGGLDTMKLDDSVGTLVNFSAKCQPSIVPEAVERNSDEILEGL